ncbi:MAG: hypothetical protein ACXV7F_10520 [Methylomonas sp.]
MFKLTYMTLSDYYLLPRSWHPIQSKNKALQTRKHRQYVTKFVKITQLISNQEKLFSKSSWFFQAKAWAKMRLGLLSRDET